MLMNFSIVVKCIFIAFNCYLSCVFSTDTDFNFFCFLPCILTFTNNKFCIKYILYYFLSYISLIIIIFLLDFHEFLILNAKIHYENIFTISIHNILQNTSYIS
ncbi:hypothetical protein EDEG_04238 [Edhazardia aedis USNM 41457]|uniref:Uncharacterized protein n=1 Tax=Edhazardia aedis (strain USNM 41457) TaxID=1003232 RepID=J9DSU4_EDHAE|nr:hypothetical protein EDEG_04238 [Edhazardia aedis USNM 41457]|eukprot:EJW04392.1 hypothetical protein EDEG_04238 [Edhazardia aedis USNM 41457]